ncbi:hypothetical protein [Sunxiuqinia elliptica]|uniref:Uncharacterized protein n=2 Tax=Sunxiuqinia elliptica TaxID=655355 RepID=A0A1I2HKN0_9BACT|nr:hypothetical protein [Sunxiuqinia elliptica]TDN99155.1 hypothetical protein DET52_107287 [Sunxiuqinia elliptica]TDO56595.1 hypothetical protein DET65_4152 [Sunxiuqinia elliptica]SFF29983.1 hypothetical protein SAMN05216283_104123 [Sunxiuqinia elliptica]
MEDKTMNISKPRVIKDFEKLDNSIQEQIKLVHPEGFSQHLITFTNKDGMLVSALPFETDEKYYLVRMTTQQAEDIISDDDDYDDEGVLKDESRSEFEDKYAELDYIAENIEDSDSDDEDEDD